MSAAAEPKRDPQAVLRARCALLRDAIVEALAVSAHYNDTAITFAPLGDDACLEMALREFARTASVATKTARELIELRNEAGRASEPGEGGAGPAGAP